MRNPFGNTSRCGTATTMLSSCCSTASTARVAGNVPSDGRSQAGGDHRRSGVRGVPRRLKETHRLFEDMSMSATSRGLRMASDPA